MGDFGDFGDFGGDIWKKIIGGTADVNPLAGAAQNAISDPSWSASVTGANGMSQGANNFLGLGLDGKPNAAAQDGKISPFGKAVGDATKAAFTPPDAGKGSGSGSPSAPQMAAPTPIMPPQPSSPVVIAAGAGAGAGAMPGGQPMGAPPGMGGFTRPNHDMNGQPMSMGGGGMSPFGRKPM